MSAAYQHRLTLNSPSRRVTRHTKHSVWAKSTSATTKFPAGSQVINIRTSIMGLPINFMKKDRGYSWIVLLAIVINNFCCMGYLFTSTGIYGSIYPDLLQEERSKTNAIGSTLVGVFLFTGKKVFYILLLTASDCM